MPESTFLIVKAPPCSWLGAGKKALVVAGATHEHDFEVDGSPLHGLWAPLQVGLANDACEFNVEGNLASGARISIKSEPRMWLENDHGRFEKDVPIHAWGCIEHPEWVKTYKLNADGTMSPEGNGDLVLGVHREGGVAKVVFVERGDSLRRIIFGGAEDNAAFFEQLRADAAARHALAAQRATDALSALTPQQRSCLRDDGFARFPGLVSPSLVSAAKAQINKLLGKGPLNQGTEAAAFASHPAIVALAKESPIPHVLAELLGGSPDFYRARLNDGQVALRFPGDNAPPGGASDALLGHSDAPSSAAARAHFEECRKNWHIDGCADPHLPGVTDHYGVIHNFSALVGVLLSDITAPMAGELCAYPGSHTALAAHFKADGGANLEAVRMGGTAKLPHGEGTDALFGRPVVSCLGKAGDVVIANHMTAHLIAPNVSPEIRYCVYFRVCGPLFEEGKQKERQQAGATAGKIANLAAMLDPWCHWPGLENGGGGKGGDKGGGESSASSCATRQASATQEELAQRLAVERSMATADYKHLQPGGSPEELLDALGEMFPSLGRETLADALMACGGDAEKAALQLS